MTKSSDLPTATKAQKAVRLIFSYDGNHVQLISQQPVEMTLPPSDLVSDQEGQQGFWAELKDEKDQTLFRRVMHNPMSGDIEVFSNDPKQTISRHTIPSPKGVFVVVVPDTAETHAVTLSSSTRSGPSALATQPSREIARFELKKK
jgi:hypothetical protein